MALCFLSCCRISKEYLSVFVTYFIWAKQPSDHVSFYNKFIKVCWLKNYMHPVVNAQSVLILFSDHDLHPEIEFFLQRSSFTISLHQPLKVYIMICMYMRLPSSFLLLGYKRVCFNLKFLSFKVVQLWYNFLCSFDWSSMS